jgi:hypothetical protein
MQSLKVLTHRREAVSRHDTKRGSSSHRHYAAPLQGPRLHHAFAAFEATATATRSRTRHSAIFRICPTMSSISCAARYVEKPSRRPRSASRSSPRSRTARSMRCCRRCAASTLPRSSPHAPLLRDDRGSGRRNFCVAFVGQRELICDSSRSFWRPRAPASQPKTVFLLYPTGNFRLKVACEGP